MKKLIRTVVLGILASWLLLALHSHHGHKGDLHASHSECRVCLSAKPLTQKLALWPAQLLGKRQDTFTLTIFDILAAHARFFAASPYHPRDPPVFPS